MKNKYLIPLNLQLFAEPGPQDPPAGSEPPAGPQNQPPEFDYDKLPQIIAVKQSITEESVLKGNFKKQGLSKEQIEQAMQHSSSRQQTRRMWQLCRLNLSRHRQQNANQGLKARLQ